LQYKKTTFAKRKYKMSFTINSNIGANVVSKNLASNQRDMDRVVERLSSGKKTINARDDAAGIAIAGKMEKQIRGLAAGIRHAQDGKSMAGTAESSMQEINKILQNMRELAVHSASGVASNQDKDFLNLEMAHLVDQVESISINSIFNNKQLLRGDAFVFYTDIDVDGMKITTVANDMAAATLGVEKSTVSIGSGVAQNQISSVILALDTAISEVNTKRAHLGAISNRFDHIMGNLRAVIDNTTRSKSVMIDADFSQETTKFTRVNVLQQGATSMLAQANAQKNLVLTLFQS
jgi:flagellin